MRTTCVVAMCLMFVAPHVAAQLKLDVNRLRPVADPTGILTAEGAAIPGVMEWRASLALQEAVALLVFERVDGTREPLVGHRLSTELWGTVGLFDLDLGGPRLRVGLSGEMEATIFQGGSLRALVSLGQSPTLDAVAFGDIRSRLRTGVHFDAFDVALEGGLSLPSGNAKAMNGDGALGGSVAAAVSGQTGPFRGLLRLGFRARPEIDTRFLRAGSELWTQAGASYHLNGTGVIPKEVGAEADFATWSAASFSEAATTAIEWRVGARWCAFGFLLTGALGTGASRGFGVPAFRALTSVGFAPGFCGAELTFVSPVPPTEAAAPAFEGARLVEEIHREPPPEPQVIVEPAPARVGKPAPPAEASPADAPPPPKIVDFDEDGVFNKEDRCFDEPGPVSNHGCPEEPAKPPEKPSPDELLPDMDGDGVPDALDVCPEEKGIQINGCPAK